MKISAIIPTNGRRKEELKQILNYIEPFFDEIIVQKDKGNQVYTRYEGIKEAKNEIVYTQDDDCLVANINGLIDNYEKDVIVANADHRSRGKYKSVSQDKICLIGYGSVFDRNLIGKMEDFRVRLGDDDLFNREADRVFTWLNKKKLINANIYNFPSAFHGISANIEHEAYLNAIIKKLKEYEN